MRKWHLNRAVYRNTYIVPKMTVDPGSIPGATMLDGSFILATSTIHLITKVPACLLGLTSRQKWRKTLSSVHPKRTVENCHIIVFLLNGHHQKSWHVVIVTVGGAVICIWNYEISLPKTCSDPMLKYFVIRIAYHILAVMLRYVSYYGVCVSWDA